MSFARALILIACVALLGCGELPSIDSGECGNAVVEPGAGEDCDRFATTPGSVCRPPGESGQCRYDCTQRDDGTRPACPPAMGCGLDGLCRWASGSFEGTPTSVPSAPRELITADIDGDHRLDLVVAERDRTVVHYFSDQTQLEAELVIPSGNVTGVSPVVGEMSGDALPDVVVPYTGGIVSSLGAEDRSLVPTGYPTLALPADVEQVYYLSLEVLPQSVGKEALLMVKTAANKVGLLVQVTTELSIKAVTTTYYTPDQLAGDIPVGNVIEDPVDSPCEELVMPFREVDRVFVFSPCKRDPAQGIVLNVLGAATAVVLPPGDTVIGPATLLDFNHDGHLDLAVGASNGKANFIDLAYGVGDGTFDSTSPVPAVGDGKGVRAGDLGDKTPLAIGDLDGDGAPDYVDAHGVYLQRTSGWEIVGLATSGSWSEARIADLNGNGVPDVFAANAGGANADFLNGAGKGSLSSFVISSDGQLGHLRVGDYDGDLLNDVAASQKAEDGAGDFLAVMFGKTSGAPQPPQRMGLLDELKQVAVAHGSTTGEPPWAVDDIITTSRTSAGEIVFAGFGGRGDRQLRSPYILVKTEGPATNLKISGFWARRLALGRFDADVHNDLTELAEEAPAKYPFVLWLVPMTDQARIRLSDARPSEPLPAAADFAHSLMASGDLDGDGLDELVLLAPAVAGGGSLAYVARSVDSGDGLRKWELGASTTLEWRFAHTEELDLGSEASGGGRMRIADVDADGDADVVALAPAPAGGGAALVVFHGDGSAKLGQPVVVPAPPDVTAFALLQADRDPELELLVLAGGRVYLADLIAPAKYAIGTTPVAELPDAGWMTTGDLDGDGVADLALGTPSSVVVFRGVPGLR